MKTYLVTNTGNGSICILGRNRIDIPAKCQDIKLELPDKTARQTVARLKQRYPLLKISEVKVAAAASTPEQDATGPQASEDNGNVASIATIPEQTEGNNSQPNNGNQAVEKQDSQAIGERQAAKKSKQG